MKKNCIFLLIITAFIFSGCTKIVTTDIGAGLLPGTDDVVPKDVYYTVQTKNAGDSLNHVGASQDFSLGYISNDPLFGKVSAAVNVQLIPNSFPVSFGNNNKDSVWLDSAVLVLSYKGIWGDSFQNLAFHVYQISSDEAFNPDSIYATSHLFQRNSEELTNKQQAFEIDPRAVPDSAYSYNEAAKNQIRIRLDSATMRRFIYSYDTSNAYKDVTSFSRYFRGFQIVPEAQGNALFRVNVQDTNTKLALYYRYADPSKGGGRDTAVKYFKASSTTTAAANYIKRDRAGALVQQYYPSANAQDSLLFLEANPGIFTKITMPDLTTLKNVIIQRAEIMMDQVPDNSDLFLTPPNIFMTTYSETYKKRFLTPSSQVLSSDSASISNLSALGVEPLSSIDPLTGRVRYSYRFDITQYVQSVISFGKPQYNFVLFGPGNDFIYAGETSSVGVPISASPLNTPAAGRVMLGGGNNTAYPMRLHIVYTTVP